MSYDGGGIFVPTNFDVDAIKAIKQELDDSDSVSPGYSVSCSLTDLLERKSVPCRVCGDRSSGKHYGVHTCDGCRGFFKRAIRRNLRFTCKEQGHCQVDIARRNQCQACRLQKCFHVNMKREAVQHERASRNNSIHSNNNSNNLNNNNNNTSIDRSEETIQYPLYPKNLLTFDHPPPPYPSSGFLFPSAGISPETPPITPPEDGSGNGKLNFHPMHPFSTSPVMIPEGSHIMSDLNTSDVHRGSHIMSDLNTSDAHRGSHIIPDLNTSDPHRGHHIIPDLNSSDAHSLNGIEPTVQNLQMLNNLPNCSAQQASGNQTAQMRQCASTPSACATPGGGYASSSKASTPQDSCHGNKALLQQQSPTTPYFFPSIGASACPASSSEGKFTETSMRILYVAVSWARSIPPFLQLPFQDQALLLEESWSELFILSVIQSALPVPETLTPSTARPPVDSHMTSPDACAESADRIADQERNVLRNVVQRFRAMLIDPTEFACMKATILFKPDLFGLRCAKYVEDMQDQSQCMLGDYIRTSQPSNHTRFGKLLLLLPLLRGVTSQTIERLFFRGEMEHMPIDEMLLGMFKPC